MSNLARIPDEELDVPFLRPGKYRHYKGAVYQVTGVGLDTESLEPVVIYRPTHLSKVDFWVRPLAMFTENIIIDGLTTPRFEYIEE